jgi:hypothetical protein
MEDTMDYITRRKIIESYNMNELAQICKPNKDYYLLYAREKYDKNRCELVNIFNADDIDKMNKIVIPYGWILIESNMKNIIDYITEYGDKNLTYLIYKYRNCQICLRNLLIDRNRQWRIVNNLCVDIKPGYLTPTNCIGDGDVSLVFEKYIYDEMKGRWKTTNYRTLQEKLVDGVKKVQQEFTPYIK